MFGLVSRMADQVEHRGNGFCILSPQIERIEVETKVGQQWRGQNSGGQREAHDPDPRCCSRKRSTGASAA